jgi:tetratricopeptide (TPR) repeat protein
MRISPLLLVLLAAFNLVSAQQKKIDSLQQVLKNSKEDTSKVNTLIALSWQNYGIGESQEAIRLAEESQALSKKINFTKGVIKSQIHLGIFHVALNEYDKALDLYSTAQALAEKAGEKGLVSKARTNRGILYLGKGEHQKALDEFNKALVIDLELNNKTDIGKCYTNIGIVYNYMGNFPKSLEYYLNALKIHESLGEKKSIVNCNVNIGTVYTSMKKPEKAIEYFNKALSIANELGDKRGIAKSNSNMGVAYARLKSYDKALGCFNKAVDLYTQLGNKSGVSKSYSSIGALYEDQNNYGVALEYYKKSLAIAEELGDKEIITSELLCIGSINYALKNYKVAQEYLLKSVALGEQIQSNDNLASAYELLSKNLYATGNYKQAYDYHEKYSDLVDSLFNVENSQKISDIRTNFEVEKKENELKLEQEKKDTITREETRRQVIIRNSIIICAVLFLVLAFLIFRNLQQSRKANEIIKLQKKEVEHQKELVEENRKEILDSIHYAKRIQNTLLANKELINANLPNNFIYFNPKDIVSGDFYWATKKDNRFYLAVCDSTGHGVPGAFMSLLNISFLNEAVNERNIQKPNEIFDHVRQRLIENISQEGQKDGMDGILICLELETKRLTYSAAHNSPVIVKNNTVVHLTADKMPVGKGELNKPFILYEINETDATLYLYTDGYADQFGGPKGKKFKYKQLDELLLSIADLDENNQKLALTEVFDKWKGNLEQVDDVCVLGIRL